MHFHSHCYRNPINWCRSPINVSGLIRQDAFRIHRVSFVLPYCWPLVFRSLRAVYTMSKHKCMLGSSIKEFFVHTDTLSCWECCSISARPEGALCTLPLQSPQSLQTRQKSRLWSTFSTFCFLKHHWWALKHQHGFRHVIWMISFLNSSNAQKQSTLPVLFYLLCVPSSQ